MQFICCRNPLVSQVFFYAFPLRGRYPEGADEVSQSLIEMNQRALPKRAQDHQHDISYPLISQVLFYPFQMWGKPFGYLGRNPLLSQVLFDKPP